MDFRLIISKLINVGFYSVILPFLLVYVIVYGILQKIDIFKPKGKANSTDSKDKDETKSINSIIAFVFALFVVASIQTVMFIQSFITNVVIFIIFIFVVLLLLAFIFGDSYTSLFFIKDNNGKTTLTITGRIIATIVFFVILGVFLHLFGIFSYTYNLICSYISQDTFLTIIFICLIGFILYKVSS